MAPRHQSHCVVNRNAQHALARVAPNQPPVVVSTLLGEDHSVFELDGRLTHVQEREFDWNVPVTFSERPAPDLESINNPVNQMGALHSACVPIVTSNDSVSYLAAINKRSNFKQSGPEDDISDEMFAQALRIISDLPEIFSGEVWEENENDRLLWLSKFDEGKKERMREAWINAPHATVSEITRKSGSVKIEVLSGKRFDRSAAARIIYAGSDVFNAITGPPQMVAMSRLLELLDYETNGERTKVGGVLEVLLGYKADDKKLAGFIIDERYREIVEGDFSRNDREQRSRVAKICAAWMKKLGMPQWYLDLLDECEEYSLTNFDFGIKVQLCYQLATGTTNTTFRNSVYNITMFATACQLQRRRGKCLVLGDDLLACLNKRLNLTEWVQTVADFKMVLKAKAPALNGEATFLSRRIFTDVETPFMLPLLGKMLVRFNARGSQNPALSDSAAMAAKALSYAFGCQNCHLLRDIFLKRYEMEDDSAEVDLKELGWSTRSMGYTVEEIKKRTMEAPNLVTEEEFSAWCYEVYELDSCDVLELFEDTILNPSPIILEDSRIEMMRKDYE